MERQPKLTPRTKGGQVAPAGSSPIVSAQDIDSPTTDDRVAPAPFEGGDPARRKNTLSKVDHMVRFSGREALRDNVRLYMKMLVPVGIVSVWMFGIFAVVSWYVPHYLCSDTSMELSVSLLLFTCISSNTNGNEIKRMLLSFRVLLWAFLRACTSPVENTPPTSLQKDSGYSSGQFNHLGLLCSPDSSAKPFLVRDKKTLEKSVCNNHAFYCTSKVMTRSYTICRKLHESGTDLDYSRCGGWMPCCTHRHRSRLRNGVEQFLCIRSIRYIACRIVSLENGKFTIIHSTVFIIVFLQQRAL